MNIPLSLKQKSDDGLIADLNDLISRERELLIQILHHLKEVEIRKLYLAKGYPSMFAYLTEALHYSEGAAQRRIQAMRLIKDLPSVEKKLAELAPETGISKERTKILSDEKILIQFVADSEMMEKIDRLRMLLSHQNPQGKYDQLFSKALDIALHKLDPVLRERRRSQSEKTQASRTGPRKIAKAGGTEHPIRT